MSHAYINFKIIEIWTGGQTMSTTKHVLDNVALKEKTHTANKMYIEWNTQLLPVRL